MTNIPTPGIRVDNQFQRREIERVVYPTPYSTGADAYLIVKHQDKTNLMIDVVSMEFTIAEPVVSLYSYYDYARVAKAYGQRIVQGEITLYARKPGLLAELFHGGTLPGFNASIQEVGKKISEINNFYKNTGKTTSIDVARLWGKYTPEKIATTGPDPKDRPFFGTVPQVGTIRNPLNELIIVYITGENSDRKYYRLIDVDIQMMNHAYDNSGKPTMEVYRFVAGDIDLNFMAHGQPSVSKAAATAQVVSDIDKPGYTSMTDNVGVGKLGGFSEHGNTSNLEYTPTSISKNLLEGKPWGFGSTSYPGYELSKEIGSNNNIISLAERYLLWLKDVATTQFSSINTEFIGPLTDRQLAEKIIRGEASFLEGQQFYRKYRGYISPYEKQSPFLPD